MGNIAIVSWDSWLRHMEIPQRVNYLLKQIQSMDFLFLDCVTVLLNFVLLSQVAFYQMIGGMRIILNSAAPTLHASLYNGLSGTGK